MEINFNNYYKNYIDISKRNSWNYMYSKKIVKQKLDEINRLNNDIQKEETLDGKILLDDKIKEIKRDLNTEPKKGEGTQLTQRGKRIFKRPLILQKKLRGNFTPIDPSPVSRERAIGGKKKRKSRKKKRKSLFKKKRTKKKRKRVKRSSKKMYRKCAKFFTKKHKLTQKKALKMCKIMFG